MTDFNQAVLDALRHRSVDGERCHLVLFAAYRPDLAREMATDSGQRYFDFRREVMSAHGKMAHAQPLRLLDQALYEQSLDSGCVLMNAEALLATRPERERRAWLADVLERRYRNPLIVPLTLFGDEALAGHGRVIDLREKVMPEQSLISRLAHADMAATG